jgi:dienelactone hydrolase
MSIALPTNPSRTTLPRCRFTRHTLSVAAPLFCLFLTYQTNPTRATENVQTSPPHTGPWDVPRLLDSPVNATWGKKQGLAQEVYYDSAPLAGQPTRVFAYFAKPEGKGPFPAMLLVHGGKGKAFPQWAEQWAKRGYAALAMDTGGNGPGGKRLNDGGPNEDDDAKFRSFTSNTIRDMWTYHAVAAVLRGHAFLAAQPEVDKQRIGITGISWGGYLTCIVAGIDDRLKVAVPVYGCGYLADNSAWSEEGRFTKMSAADRQRWIESFDPAGYLPASKCPMLFVNGTNDFAYPLDSYQKSYRLVTAPLTLRVTVNMRHSHEAGWAPAEIAAFVDSALKEGPPLLRLHRPILTATTVTTKVEGDSLAAGQLNFTTDVGKWQDRKWQIFDAKWESTQRRLTAELPTTRPITFFFTATDNRGLITSSEHMTREN